MIRIFMIGYSQNKGGVEAYIKNLHGALDTNKFQVIYSMPEMKIDGKVWIRPRNRHNYTEYRKFWKKFYAENSFDVLYYNTCDIVSIDQLKFAKAAGVPVRIIHSHSTGNQQSVDRYMNIFHRISEKNSRRNLEKYATHLFACSKSAGDWMYNGRTYEIIRNGIQLSRFQYSETLRARLRHQYELDNGTLVGVIGRLSPEKNLKFAIKVMKEVLERDKNAQGVFLGDGELRESVKQWAVDSGIENRIKLIGAVDNVHEWMSAIDCLLMPSLFEGLPFVLVEAQAAGLPCVVSAAVSNEANITGTVRYISLDQSPQKWADEVLAVCGQRYMDTANVLKKAGYSMEQTAKHVGNIIEKAVCDS